MQNQPVLVHRRLDCLVSRAVRDSLSLRRSLSRLLEAACLVQKLQRRQDLEALEQLELLALVRYISQYCTSQ